MKELIKQFRDKIDYNFKRLKEILLIKSLCNTQSPELDDLEKEEYELQEEMKYLISSLRILTEKLNEHYCNMLKLLEQIEGK